MPVYRFGNQFPKGWIYGKHEDIFLNDLECQMKMLFRKNTACLLSLTWFNTANMLEEQMRFRKFCEANVIDDLVLFASVDPVRQDDVRLALEISKPTRVLKVGHFAGRFAWNYFAAVLADEFESYDEHDLSMMSIKHKFVSYARKPYKHRVDLTKMILDAGLYEQGIMTLGKSDYVDELGPVNHPHLTLNENVLDYVKHGHWYGKDDPTGIPSDFTSLQRMDIWQNHFLHVVNETTFVDDEDVFLNQITWKPIIGMRPFVINGNPRIIRWLQDKGFKTFNHVFGISDEQKLSDVHRDCLSAIKMVCGMDDSQLAELYREIFPYLRHNRTRFIEFSESERDRFKQILTA